MPVFPSVEWFDAVRDVYNSDDAYRGAGGGICDALVGVKVGEKLFLLVFDGFECSGASEIDEAQLEETDFYLDLSPEGWREMIANIGDNGAAGFGHTLNTLDLTLDDGLAHSATGDQYRQDLFFRYNQTFQFFFDASARIETQLA